VCEEDHLTSAYAWFGGTARVPALWLYSASDRYFWPGLVWRMFSAYGDEGAPVRLEMVGALWFTEDGHELVNLGGRELWRPRIDEFLEVIGAPNWDGDPGDAAVPNWDPPPALAPADHPAWRRYLGFGGHKAFAMGQGGRFGWAAHRVTPELARSHALRFCESELDVCRIISVAGEQPVETNPSPSLDVDGSPTGY